MPAQLRIYDIAEGRMDEFVREFLDKVVPPRRQYGFEVIGPWIHEDRNQFVWITTYDGPLEWQDAVDRYYHSPERSSIDFEPRDYITAMDTRMLTPA